MKRLNVNVMLILGAMLLFIVQSSSFSQIDTSGTDTDRTGTTTTPGTDRTGTTTTPGTDTDRTGTTTPGSTDRTGTATTPGSTDVPGTAGIMGDTTGRASRYYSQAENITNDLKTRLNLTSDQANEIRDILIDYQSDIAEQDMAGTTTDRTTETGTDTERSSEVGGTKDRSDLQQTVNERIESVLNDNQKQQFSGMQTEWWNKVNTKFKKGAEKSKSGSDMNNWHNDNNKTPDNSDTDTNTDTDTDTNTDKK